MIINDHVTSLCIYYAILFIVILECTLPRLKKACYNTVRCYTSSLICFVFTVSFDCIIFSCAWCNLLLFYKFRIARVCSVDKVSSCAQSWPRPSHTHSPLTHLPRATSSLQASFRGNAYTHEPFFIFSPPIFYLLYHIFTVPFCLDLHILSIVSRSPTVFTIVTCCASR